MSFVGIMLQLGSVGFSDLLNHLEVLGFFRYVLPFLLIFAVVYAVLTKIHVFEENKGAAIVVALAIGLLALQFDKVPAFFQNIFPKFGIGLAFLLIALILAGAFIPTEKKEYNWVFFTLGMLIFAIVALTSFSDWQFLGAGWWQEYGAIIITGLVIIAAIVGIILASKHRES